MKQWTLVLMVMVGSASAAWAEDVGAAKAPPPLPDDAGPSADVPPWTSCVADSDCAPEESCQSGQCLWAGPPCTKLADCNPGEACVSGHCQWVGPPCKVDADCSPFDECVGAFCVYKGPPCSEKADCAPMEACDAGHCTWVGCSTDADCGPGASCDLEAKWCQAIGCSQNSDCPNDGSKCIYGLCGDAKGLCQADGECPQYTLCEVESWGGGGGGAKPAQDAGGTGLWDPDANPDAGPPITTDPWGQCVIDVVGLPEDATCKDLCTKAAACYAEAGGGSGDAAADAGAAPSSDASTEFVPPPEDAGGWTPSPDTLAWFEKTCNAKCNYAAATDAADAEIAALADCLQGISDCQAMEAACSDEGDAWGQLLEKLPELPSDIANPPWDPGGDVDVPPAADDSTPTGAETTDTPGGSDNGGGQTVDVGTPIGSGDAEAVSDLYDPPAPGSDVSPGADAIGADAGATAPAPSSGGSGGCSSAMAPAAPWASALMLFVFALLLRRRAVR